MSFVVCRTKRNAFVCFCRCCFLVVVNLVFFVFVCQVFVFVRVFLFFLFTCLFSYFFVLQLYLDEPDAKVLLLDDFASDAECKALMDSASPHLQVYIRRLVL